MTTTPKATAELTPASIQNDLLPNLTIDMVPIENLVPSDHRIHKYSKPQIAKCRKSIELFGVSLPALVTGNNEIIDGHTIVEAARQIGLAKFPCARIIHLNKNQIRGLRIALNQIQRTGEIDDENFKLELEFQLEINTDLTDLGYEPPEIDLRLGLTEDGADNSDSADELDCHTVSQEPCVTKPGDVWELGPHVVVCGNMRDSDQLAELLSAASVDLVFADPPFNTKVNGHIRVGMSAFEEFAEASGEMTPEEFIQFLTDYLVNSHAVLKPGGLLFSFMDWRHEWELHEAIRASGLEQINKCIWVKPNGGMGSFYRSRYESIFVLKKPGAPHTNNVQLGSNGRNRTNVWEYAGATGGKHDEADDFSLHPTVKPIRLVEDALLDASAVGDTVFDPFLGSGTTLLAAERKKRRCIGIEIAPAYVDVAIRRWQDMTGLDAMLQSTGETFSTCEFERALGTDASGSDQPSTPANDPKVEDF